MIVFKIILVIFALILLGISVVVGGVLLAYITVSVLVYLEDGDNGQSDL